jgi:uncharacterized protein YdeI (YjbR/CyaY-like superfamily)
VKSSSSLKAVSLNASVDAYIAKSAPFAQPILNHLRETVHAAVPDVEETIKWSMPFFVYRGVILGNMSAFKAHCAFGIWGKEVAKEMRADGVTEGGSMGSFGRITSLKELPPRKELVAYVKKAAKAVADGTRTKAWERQKVAKPEAVVPEELAAAFKKNKAAAKNFAAMPPGSRREYCDWVGGAKRETTREERALKAVAQLAENKKLNWKYESC